MSDLISRQAAIRIVKGAYTKSKDIDHFYALLLTAFENILPFAQPDLSGYSDRLWETAYERCRQDAIEAIEEITWYHQNRNNEMVSGANSSEHQAWHKAEDVYKALEDLPSAQPEQRWIPWDNGKFPEESGTYNVTAYDGVTNRVTHAKYQKRLKRWELTGARAYWRVLAWMPLPEPYQEES